MSGDDPSKRVLAEVVGLVPSVNGFDNVQDAMDQIGAGALSVATAHLTVVEMATLMSAPTEIVAAPGVGAALMVLGATAEFVQGVTSSWDTFTPTLAYDVWAAANLATPQLLDREFDVGSVFGAGGPRITSSTVSKFFDRSIVENTPLVVTNGGSNDPHVGGSIVAASIAGGGLLYAPGDAGTIQGNDSSATYEVDTVGGGGVVTAFHVVNPGTINGYTTIDNPLATAPTTGAGDGNFTVNITDITPPDGDLYVAVLYRVVALH